MNRYLLPLVCGIFIFLNVIMTNWVPRGSSWVRAARDPLGFFRGSILGQDTSEPSLVLVKPRKTMNNVNCRRDMTEILLKAA